MVIGWLLVGYCWLSLIIVGYWLVLVGYCWLLVGYWLVIVGYHWLLLVIVGYWLVIVGCILGSVKMKGFVHVIIVIFPNHREISIFP